METIKCYKKQIRIIKLYKAYGNFILELYRRNRDLNTLRKNHILAQNLLHDSMMWSETANGFYYWNEIDWVLNKSLKEFHDKEFLDKTKEMVETSNHRPAFSL